MQPLVILEPVTIQAVGWLCNNSPLSHHLSLHNLKKLVSYKMLLETHPTRKCPVLAVYNHRPIWKKLKNFCVEFHEMRMGITFHSEVWRRKEGKRQKYMIESRLDMETGAELCLLRLSFVLQLNSLLEMELY